MKLAWSSLLRTRFDAACLALSLVVASILSAHAQTITILHSFAYGTADGGTPRTGLIQDAAGNLYGTTSFGGDTTCDSGTGCGTVFKIDSLGNETVLYSFHGSPDGAWPAGNVIRDAAGNLYGVTNGGGEGCSQCGTVFKLSPAGIETVLYSFKGGTDGYQPIGGLVRDAAGNLYGVTTAGGSPKCYFDFGCGTIFKVDSSGNETVLYAFAEPPDASNPEAGLIRDDDGNLYGTTFVGGDASCNSPYGSEGCGAVFELNPSGVESVLYRFTGEADGALPGSGGYGLTRDATGNLYGTTSAGGDLSCIVGILTGCGTVFKIDPSGVETTLYAFAGGGNRGKYGAIPNAGLILDPAGNLYGTAEADGAFDEGTMFRLDQSGNLTGHYSFTGGTSGGLPLAGLLRDGQGNLYGTTQDGGTYAYGTVFKLTP
jgi:uncharacterized repeat protein (TIGR03803 family)